MVEVEEALAAVRQAAQEHPRNEEQKLHPLGCSGCSISVPSLRSFLPVLLFPVQKYRARMRPPRWIQSPWLHDHRPWMRRDGSADHKAELATTFTKDDGGEADVGAFVGVTLGLLGLDGTAGVFGVSRASSIALPANK